MIRFANIDDDLNLPAAVRGKIAENLADVGTVEGAAVDGAVAARITTPGSATETALSATIDGKIDAAVSGLDDQPQILANTARLYEPYLAKWFAGLAAVRAGSRDAKVLCIGDSTTHGTGGGAGDFQPRNSYPSYLADLLGAHAARSSYGLAVPPAHTAQNDGRWVHGSGWSRITDALTDFIGYGGKAASFQGGGNSAGALVFQDPRIMADTFDVYYVETSGVTGGVVSATATGGSTVTAVTNNRPANAIKKLTVIAGAPATTNTVSITNTGTGTIYIVGIEPSLSTVRKVRVGNAGVSGSNSVGWVAYPNDNTAFKWNSMAAIAAYEPDLTIIDLGINDTATGSETPVATFIANIETLVTAASLSGDVVIKTMMPSDDRASAQNAIVDALRLLDLPLVDIYGHYDGTFQTALMTDSLHPNAAGYADEARYLYAALS